ncbi:MAG: YbbR-like domain-containing protein [Paludibacter sp.]
MAENTGKILLQYYTKKLKTFFFSKDILSFLLFLLISTIFWYVHALGKERETTIKVPIHYVGVPLNMALTNDPPMEISVDIKDQGIRFFDYGDAAQNPINIDISRLQIQKGEVFITPEQLKSRIVRYLKPTTIIQDFHPNSILIRYEMLSHKTLPVEFISKIELEHQYMLSSDIRLQPNIVTVYGPKKMLDTLKYVRTECKSIENLNDTVSFNCNFIPLKSVQYSVNKTKVTIFVEQFTERKVQIPITAINCPENLMVRTFPAEVNATCTIGLSKFKNFNSSDIQVYLDYNELKSDITSKHVLKIKSLSKNISNIRISPLEVEYILEQK